LDHHLTPTSFDELAAAIRTSFGDDTRIVSFISFQELAALRQTKSVQAYNTAFIQLSVRVQPLLPDAALILTYRNGLKSAINSYLATSGRVFNTLDEWMDAAAEYDEITFKINGSMAPSQARSSFVSRNSRRNTESFHRTSAPPRSPVVNLDVKEVRHHGSLTPQERQRRVDNHLCIYDGLSDCPGARDLSLCPRLKRRNTGRSTPSSSTSSTPSTTTAATTSGNATSRPSTRQ
jgi:hypothetical protein